MLMNFSVSNFRSFRDRATLDISAGNMPLSKHFLLEAGKNGKLLPVCALSGPTGSGKSNTLLALSSLIDRVTRPIRSLQGKDDQFILQREAQLDPYLFENERRVTPSSFTVTFLAGETKYQYSFSAQESNVMAEKLTRFPGSAKEEVLFERGRQDLKLGKMLREAHVSDRLSQQIPYLSFLAASYEIPAIKEVETWFKSCITKECDLKTFCEDLLRREKTLDFLNQMAKAVYNADTGIVGFDIDEDHLVFQTKRMANSRMWEMDLENESKGTKKLLEVIPCVLLALREGRLLVLEDLDVWLDTKTLLYLIQLFKDPEMNKKGAQLLFSLRNAKAEESGILRRDEIVYTEMGRNRITSLHRKMFHIENVKKEDRKDLADQKWQAPKKRSNPAPEAPRKRSGQVEMPTRFTMSDTAYKRKS